MGMNINFNYDNFRSSYGMQQIPVVRTQDVAAQNKPETAPVQEAPVKEQAPAQEYNRASRVANLEDVSLTFNKEDSFDNIGSEVDITNLDMTKAISDMRRDSILSDYQTFVGPTADKLMAGLDDGIVFMK